MALYNATTAEFVEGSGEAKVAVPADATLLRVLDCVNGVFKMIASAAILPISVSQAIFPAPKFSGKSSYQWATVLEYVWTGTAVIQALIQGKINQIEAHYKTV